MPQRRAQWHEQCDRKIVTGKGLLFRTRFIAEYVEHSPNPDAIGDLIERPDDFFQSLWMESMLAVRLGHPPHGLLSFACVTSGTILTVSPYPRHPIRP